MQTSIRNIYAAGDVTGPYQFTHMASYQAVKVVYNSVLKIPQKTSYSYVPWTTYTMPEVAHVGYTEEWALKQKLFREKVMIPLAENDRAKTEGERAGFLKLIIGKKNRLIGATIVGNKAGEMIPLASLALNKKMKATVFSSLILSYPTESEIYAKASLEILKRSFRPWMKSLIKNVFLRKI
jgi:pyruvate/2-oxoglutarate dehydrogenase complex dihydrolipoamide dehydrogenase (E3) component